MSIWPDRFPLFPDTASEMAREIDAIYFFGLGIAAIFSVLIAVSILYLALRYRRRSEDEVGKPEKEMVWLEIAWSIIPLAILMVMFVWGAKVYFQARRPPADAYEYYVTAKQWMWKFQHPEGNSRTRGSRSRTTSSRSPYPMLCSSMSAASIISELSWPKWSAPRAKSSLRFHTDISPSSLTPEFRSCITGMAASRPPAAPCARRNGPKQRTSS